MQSQNVWSIIRNHVQSKQWNTGGLKALQNNTVVLSKEQLHYNEDDHVCRVHRNGDLVVGFYQDDLAASCEQCEQCEQTLKMTIGGVPLPVVTVRPGEFVYIFENTHVFPINAVQYAELIVHAQSYTHLSVIYALLSDNMRKLIAPHTNIVRLSQNTAIIRGCFGFVDNVEEYLQIYLQKHPKSTIIEIPNMVQIEG